MLTGEGKYLKTCRVKCCIIGVMRQKTVFSKKRLRAWFFLAGMLFSGCVGQQRARLPYIADEPPETAEANWIIVDYKNRDHGEEIPEWVNFFLENNISSIEKLNDNQGCYTFLGINSGTNFQALRQWRDAFNPDLDFARLAAARMEKRFLAFAASYPDDEYGGYFEEMIRAASDARWTGAIKQDDFWIYRHFQGEDEITGTASDKPLYDFLILVVIDKGTLAAQINTLLRNVQSPVPLTRDQRNAVARIQERFFEDF